jgi:hypothetical protein
MNQSALPADLSRRSIFTAAGLGLAAIAVTPSTVDAAEWTAAEKANVQVVKDFCAAFPNHDINQVMAFFAENGAYRMSEAQEPNKGRQSVMDRIGSYINSVQKVRSAGDVCQRPDRDHSKTRSFRRRPTEDVAWRGGLFSTGRQDRRMVRLYDFDCSRIGSI